MKKKLIVSLLLTACLACPAVFAGCDFDFSSIFGSSNPSDDNTPTAHVHDLTRETSEHTSCTGETIEYWHCDGCGQNFIDGEGKTVIADMDAFSSGHVTALQSGGDGHYNKCVNCGEIIGDILPHESEVWAKTKTEHYKTCTVCGGEYDRDEHEMNDNACLDCGYFTNYAERCASAYGYGYLGAQTKGEAYQSFYDSLDEVIKTFDETNGDATRIEVTSGGAKNFLYTCGTVDYSDFGLTTEEALCVWSTYRNDHPLYYWINSTSAYGNNSLSPCVDSAYVKGTTRAKANETVFAAIQQYTALVHGETSAYQITLALHDEIINNIDYARDSSGNPSNADWAHDIMGVFDKKKAVCDGYSKTFQLLLSVCGIESAYVTGFGNNENHAWNMVRLDDGKWYWYDLTWDDQPNYNRGIIYDYFCVEGASFKGHTVNAAGDFKSSSKFQCGLPAASTDKYDADGAARGDTFTVDNLIYEISGFNIVTLIAAADQNAVDAKTALPSHLERGGRSYALVEIGSEVFVNNGTLTEITIPRTVTAVNNFAFRKCNKLTAVNFEKTDGWRRHKQDGKTAVYENITQSDLKNPAYAATLLKDCYTVGNTMYQYVWTNDGK